jgi:hypothetical protein
MISPEDSFLTSKKKNNIQLSKSKAGSFGSAFLFLKITSS